MGCIGSSWIEEERRVDFHHRGTEAQRATKGGVRRIEDKEEN
jgi:hypothetical protein